MFFATLIAFFAIKKILFLFCELTSVELSSDRLRLILNVASLKITQLDTETSSRDFWAMKSTY